MKASQSRPPRGLARAPIAAAITSLSFLVSSGCGLDACGPTVDNPSTERRELAALDEALKNAPPVSYWHSVAISARAFPSGKLETKHFRIHVSIPRLLYLRATAVHGHQAVLVDYAARNHYHYEDTEGVSSELRQLWNRIYRENHPHDREKDVTTVLIVDAQGRYRIEVSVPQCAMP